MPTAKALYFLQGQLLGQSEFESPHPPHSLVYICPTCGDAWGRIMVEWEGRPATWSVSPTPCPKHEPTGVQDWGSLPGAFCVSIHNRKDMLSIMWWARALEHLPPAVLQREFQLLLNNYDERSQYADILNASPTPT